jgi:hypothetical protein
MDTVETPKANPENLLKIVMDAYEGKVVLPEFQRPFVWPRDSIEELLTSILHGYFVGTFLLLDTPADHAMFSFRPVEGLERVNPNADPRRHATVRLVLDGQQRITSAFYALFDPQIPLKSARYPHKFFLRLDLALNGDLDEAVTGVSIGDRRRVAEIEGLVSLERALPFSLFRDSSAFYGWLYNQQSAWPGQDERRRIEALYRRVSNFMVPVVSLSPAAGKDNIVNIFERINRTGVSLSLFDLATARLYVKGVRLRDMWKTVRGSHRDLAAVAEPELWLKVIALMEGVQPQRAKLLDVVDNLPANDFRARWAAATSALVLAHERLTKRYGAFRARWIPYSTMIVPLAAILFEVRGRNLPEQAYRKVDRWYWSSVFSQRYDAAVDSRAFQDCREVQAWVSGGVAPDWVERLSAQQLDFNVDDPRSGVYRGMMCMISMRGARDFITGQPAPLHECEDDHIFPRAAFRGVHPVDQAPNRSVISRHTNERIKRAKRPSVFLKECLDGHGGEVNSLLETLDSHFIPGEAYQALQDDDFVSFASARATALKRGVERLLERT